MSKLKIAAPGTVSLREETIRVLVDGRKRFHDLPDDYRATGAAGIRREALERICSFPLGSIGHRSFGTTMASQRNGENMPGVAQIPMGIVGPLTVHGEHIDGDVWVPMATDVTGGMALRLRTAGRLTAAGTASSIIDGRRAGAMAAASAGRAVGGTRVDTR